ncbi:hypothetical protein CONLIGDRAFT_639770 [Coniochaeta ligniaria NRRL 30616]|uniref:Uncharacterized protein n=1 Tax=Coniochaeta ligniaria NRRL 30616 TaxID=1408157 RepID=A0A1J7JZB3_9PEZI|nr:hypothetical protein CONLIGDRAFT_639770 [Coniochaeta ligniaria NRRL 30616]
MITDSFDNQDLHSPSDLPGMSLTENPNNQEVGRLASHPTTCCGMGLPATMTRERYPSPLGLLRGLWFSMGPGRSISSSTAGVRFDGVVGLSRQSNTLKVPSSSLGRITFASMFLFCISFYVMFDMNGSEQQGADHHWLFTI